MATALVAVSLLVVPLSAGAAEGPQKDVVVKATSGNLPEHVTYNGRQYRIVRAVQRVKALPRQEMDEQEPPALRSVPIRHDELPDTGGLRDSLATYTFYRQAQSQWYAGDSWCWGNDYYLDLPPGLTVAVTEVNQIGLVNASGGPPTDYDDVAVLVEAYDFFTEKPGTGEPVHTTYLGGAMLYYGTLLAGEQSGPQSWAADPGEYFFEVSNDGNDQIFLSVYTGQVVGGQFVPFALNDTVSMTFTIGAAGAPTIGSTPGSFYGDGFGSTPGDRIYTAADGRVWYGDDSYLRIELAGEAWNDCNEDDFIDDTQVVCGDSLGPVNCATGSCTYFLNLATDGFEDPLGVGWIVPGACDFTPDNGIPDECDTADCNSNGVGDGLDIAGATSEDCNGNTVPDECEIDVNSTAPGGPFFCYSNCNPDCNDDGIPDDCQLTDNDCNVNYIPDECELADGSDTDCDGNGLLDHCEHYGGDCNGNGQIDFCDIYYNWSVDANTNGVPDECDSGSYCFWPWDFNTDEGYVLGPIDGQPTAETDPEMQWVKAGGDGTGVFDVAELLDACNVDGWTLKIQGTSNDDRVNSPLYSLPEYMTEDASRQVLFFDYKVTNDATADATQVAVVDANEMEVVYLEFAVYDMSTNATPDLQNVIMVGDDGSGFVYIFTAPTDPTAFRWTVNVCDEIGIWLFKDGGSMQPTELGFTFGSAATTIWVTGGPGGGGQHMAQFDNTLNWTPSWSGGTAGQVHDFYMDNVQLCNLGADLPFPDCNFNGIHDTADIRAGAPDCNGNGTMDECEIIENRCLDCDRSGTLDSCEIDDNGGSGGAGGTLDTDANGILDVCQVDSYAAGTNGFESPDFVAGEDIGGQQGWWHRLLWHSTLGYADGIVNVDPGPSGWGQSLVIDPATAPGARGIGTPLYPDVETEPGIQEWSFKLQIDSTNYDLFDLFYMTLADFCDDGVRVSTTATHGRYSPLAGMIIYQDDDPIEPFKLEVWNRDSETMLRWWDTSLGWGLDQPLNLRMRVSTSRGQMEVVKSASERQTLYQTVPYNWGKSPLAPGQVTRNMIFHGNDPTSLRYIDNVYYRDGKDCDRDDRYDQEAIDAGLVADENSDNIPDRCQDCNDDCVFYNLGLKEGIPTDPNCLDPLEILAGANDCDGNGVPDTCDVNTNNIGWFTTTVGIYNSCDEAMWNGVDPLPADCFISRAGCDVYLVDEGTGARTQLCDCGDDQGNAPGDGIPDNCQYTSYSLEDCNENGIIDGCDIAAGTSDDVDANGVPDECLDCNGADFDGDDDIDLKDFQIFQRCFVEGPTAAGCECTDLDGDAVVDYFDLEVFWWVFFGPI
ncbi:MAG: hypothetical protein JSV19_05075 [Phycisphaerales bacterium]|nr:MAG: hypothetical protein JSV19_05075 [Phycisphaerales bacterium]